MIDSASYTNNYDRQHFINYLNALKSAPPIYEEIEEYEIKSDLHIPGYRLNFKNRPIHVIPNVLPNEILLPITHSELLPNILPGRYYISNLGRIYDAYREKYLYGTNNGRGYLNVKLSYLTESGYYVNYKTIYIHQLVCFYFHYFPGCYSKNDPRFMQVNHMDLNKHNNNAENLEWSTNCTNVKYSIEVTNYSTNYYAKNTPITEDKVREVCIKLKEGYGIRDTARAIFPDMDLLKAEAVVETIRYKRARTNISREYDLPDPTPATRRYLTDEQIHSICYYLSLGYRDIDIIKLVGCTSNQFTGVKYDGIAPDIRHQYGL